MARLDCCLSALRANKPFGKLQMKEQALISVVVPVYNMAKFLSRCVDSILGQTYQNLEIILVDDFSQDESPAIIAQYAQSDCRIKTV